MSEHKWLLVEWAGNQDVFSTYGIVKSDSLINDGTQLKAGNFIVVGPTSSKPPRRAQILKISGNKNSLKEHKLLMERQDNQVKNVLALCVRTLTEAKNDSLMFGRSLSPMNRTVSVASQHHVGGSEESESEQEILINERTNRLNRVVTKPRYPTQSYNGHHSMRNENFHNDDRVYQEVTRTQSPSRRPKTIIYREQQTQTCDELLQKPSAEDIARLENTIEELHETYQSLLMRLNIQRGLAMANSEAIDIEPARSDPEENMNDVSREHNAVTPDEEDQNAESLQVRRVSAHTTNDVEPHNDVEMVPIGAGYARVPVRLLREIDWTSYTHATRVLLQAIFPRKILATHSLTGKQSPAFLDKPPKKRLDPKIVDDIVELVSERCGVLPRLVRNIITIKCTDESKLYRNRLEFKQKRLEDRENQENFPPPPSPTRDESLIGGTE